jgi:sugar phosphate isomerase/epimerase
MGLALSASWKAFAYRSGKRLLLDIQKAGFSEVELSFNITRRMLAEIKACYLSLGIKIVSVHNFCPIPGGFTRKKALPDCYSIASLDNKQRLLAVAFTKKSIDTACVFGARVVVLHCGRVEVPDRTKEARASGRSLKMP